MSHRRATVFFPIHSKNCRLSKEAEELGSLAPPTLATRPDFSCISRVLAHGQNNWLADVHWIIRIITPRKGPAPVASFGFISVQAGRIEDQDFISMHSMAVTRSLHLCDGISRTMVPRREMTLRFQVLTGGESR
jgi:hypothetical protein